MSTLDMFEPARKSSLSQWMSPSWIARRLARWVARPVRGFVLEPSAGSGELIEGLLRAGWPLKRIVAVELDPEWCGHLARRFPGLQLIEGDFLDRSVQLQLEALEVVQVVQNPPYEAGLDVAFLERSLALVRETGSELGAVTCLVKTDIEYSVARAPFWAGKARVDRRARVVERPSFGRHVDGQEQGGAERNYVGLSLRPRTALRAPGTVEAVFEEAWSRTDPESAWQGPWEPLPASMRTGEEQASPSAGRTTGGPSAFAGETHEEDRAPDHGVPPDLAAGTAEGES